jgi:acyl-CoA thioester hydrolase
MGLTEHSTHRLTTPLEGTPALPWDDTAPIAAPLHFISPVVGAQWVDYNGHMSESCYLLAFGDSSDAFFRYIGIDEAYRAAGYSLYTVQTMIFNLREVAEGEQIRLTLQLLDADEKRLHIFHTMVHASTGETLATGEQLLVHVDMHNGRSAPMPATLQHKTQAILKAHGALPRPAQAGASVGIRKK